MKISENKIRKLIFQFLLETTDLQSVSKPSRESYNLDKITFEEAEKLIKILEQEKNGIFEPSNESEIKFVVALDKKKENLTLPKIMGHVEGIKFFDIDDEHFQIFKRKLISHVDKARINSIYSDIADVLDPYEDKIFEDIITNIKKYQDDLNFEFQFTYTYSVEHRSSAITLDCFELIEMTKQYVRQVARDGRFEGDERDIIIRSADMLKAILKLINFKTEDVKTNKKKFILILKKFIEMTYFDVKEYENILRIIKFMYDWNKHANK